MSPLDYLHRATDLERGLLWVLAERAEPSSVAPLLQQIVDELRRRRR